LKNIIFVFDVFFFQEAEEDIYSELGKAKKESRERAEKELAEAKRKMEMEADALRDKWTQDKKTLIEAQESEVKARF